jgi:hypothetical protein
MLGIEFKGISQSQKGYMALFFGTVLLLHTLDIFTKWLSTILIICATIFIIYGVIESEIIPTTIAFIKRKTGKKNTGEHK